MEPLACSTGGGDKSQQSFQKPEGGVACNHWGGVSCENAPPVALVTSDIGKKEGTATKHHLLLILSPWNTPTLLLQLPSTLSTAHT